MRGCRPSSSTFLPALVHTCTALHPLLCLLHVSHAHSGVFLHVFGHMCKLWHLPARPCSGIHTLAHFYLSLLTCARSGMSLCVLAHRCTLWHTSVGPRSNVGAVTSPCMSWLTGTHSATLLHALPHTCTLWHAPSCPCCTVHTPARSSTSLHAPGAARSEPRPCLRCPD